EAGREALGAELVVELPLLLVGENLVRERDLLEAVGRLGVVWIDVGMVLAGELAIRLADLVGRRRLRDPAGLVQIPLCHALSPCPPEVWVPVHRPALSTVLSAAGEAIGEAEATELDREPVEIAVGGADLALRGAAPQRSYGGLRHGDRDRRLPHDRRSDLARLRESIVDHVPDQPVRECALGLDALAGRDQLDRPGRSD